MLDYYTVLAQKIQETRDDPVKIRNVVYEAARLALRWQVQEQWPGLSIIQSKSHIRELEDAIARLEADAAGPGGRDSRESAAAGLKAGRLSRDASVESEEDDAPNVVAESHLQPPGPPPVEPADLEAGAAGRGGRSSREPAKAAAGLNASRQSRNATIEPEENDAAFSVEAPHPQPGDDPLPAGQADLIGSRKLNLVHSRRAYLVNPADLVNPDLTRRLPVASHSGARMAGAGLMIALQLAVATLAEFYECKPVL
jgi:hypothetical protein